MSTMLISELAARSGVPVTTLRFYEGAGLLPAGRTASGYRVYGQDAVERLAFIGAAKRLGFPLEKVGELLTVREAGACADVRDGLRRRVAARLAEAGQRAAELQAFTALLCGALEHLDACLTGRAAVTRAAGSRPPRLPAQASRFSRPAAQTAATTVRTRSERRRPSRAR